jgi:hypothetical protein
LILLRPYATTCISCLNRNSLSIVHKLYDTSNSRVIYDSVWHYLAWKILIYLRIMLDRDLVSLDVVKPLILESAQDVMGWGFKKTDMVSS